MIFKHYIQDDRNKQRSIYSRLKKFTDIYNARKDLLPILSDGVNERMELYLNKKDTIKEN